MRIFEKGGYETCGSTSWRMCGPRGSNQRRCITTLTPSLSFNESHCKRRYFEFLLRPTTSRESGREPLSRAERLGARSRSSSCFLPRKRGSRVPQGRRPFSKLPASFRGLRTYVLLFCSVGNQAHKSVLKENQRFGGSDLIDTGCQRPIFDAFEPTGKLTVQVFKGA